MLISAKHNFVFLCTPKCASVAIEAMLRDYSDIVLLGPPYFRHTNYRLYSKYLRPYIEEVSGKRQIETVCLVREPLSWLYSHYRFRSRYELRNASHVGHEQSTGGISYSQFVAAYMKPDPPTFARIRSQFQFVKDDSDDIGVDRLFLFERMDEFVEFMSRKVGRRLSLALKNVSPPTNREFRISALTDRAIRKTRSLLHLTPHVQPRIPDQIPALKDFMRADFQLYEYAKRSGIRHVNDWHFPPKDNIPA